MRPAPPQGPDGPHHGSEQELVVQALGVRVTAALDQPWLTPAERASVAARWSRARPAGTGDPALRDPGRRAPSVRVPDAALRRATDLSGLAAALSTQITLAAIGARAGELIMLHAAGLADPGGRAIALVGPSGRGKTSAARVLARHWGYLSDETVACDPHTRRVFAHPKPLSVRQGEQHKRQHGPDELGLLHAPQTCTLQRIVMLDRDPEHRGGPALSAISMITALGELTPQLSYLDRLPSPLQALAGLITATHGVLRVRYAEAADLPKVLPDLLTAASRHERWWVPEPEITGPEITGPEITERSAAAARLRPAAVLDAVTDGEQEVVLLAPTDVRGPRIAVLAGIGPAVRGLATREVPYEQWIPRLTDSHGRPPDGDLETLLAGAVRDLVGAGVLVGGGRP